MVKLADFREELRELGPQIPAAQVATPPPLGTGQTFPQAPQLRRSFGVWTHVSVQRVHPAGQEEAAV